MAILKDLIVTGASKYIGDAYFQIIKAGSWNGNTIDVAHGGTNVNSGVGSKTNPVFLSSTGITKCDYNLNATVNNGTTNTLVYYSGTNALSAYTSNKGKLNIPVYINAGVPTTCDTYAGGTAVTLNESDKRADTASFYAPTSVGTAGWVLTSVGSSSTDKTPIWTKFEDTGLTTLTATNYSLTNSEWTKVTNNGIAITFTGTYALEISTTSNKKTSYFSGIFSCYNASSSSEITLHSCIDSGNNVFIFAAVKGDSLYISSSDSVSTTRNVVIKVKKLI